MSESFLGRRYLRPEPSAFSVFVEGDRINGGVDVEAEYEAGMPGFVWGDDFTLTIDGDTYTFEYDIGDEDYVATATPPEGSTTGETLSQDGNDWTVDVTVSPPP